MSAAEIILTTGATPTNPASGKVSLYTKTDNILYYRDSAGNEVALGALPNRNALINGSFAIWQRQINPATTTEYADDEYCADRWYVLTQSNPIDAERIDGDTQRYAARLTQKQATAQQIGLAQIIEGANCQHLRGQEVTFSVRTQCSAAETVNIAVLEWGGTEDSVTSDVAASWSGSGLPTLATNVTQAGSTGQTALSASTWADVSTTVTLGSSFTNLIIFVWTDTTLSQNTTLDLEAAQLERGGVATPFEVRPVGAELALCQRYFERRGGGSVFEHFAVGFYYDADTAFFVMFYPTKRASPTITFGPTVGDFEIIGPGLRETATSLSLSYVTTSNVRVNMDTAIQSAGLLGFFRANGTTAAYIHIDAEL
jgi:hypothetical protein